MQIFQNSRPSNSLNYFGIITTIAWNSALGLESAIDLKFYIYKHLQIKDHANHQMSGPPSFKV